MNTEIYGVEIGFIIIKLAGGHGGTILYLAQDAHKIQ